MRVVGEVLEDGEGLGDSPVARVFEPRVAGRRSPERQLEGRAFHLLGEDHEVVRIEPDPLLRRTEQVVGMPGQVLVYGLRARDLQDEARLPAPTDASGALPERGLRAGISDEHGDVERPDVDPELERVRRDHDLYRSRSQARLDLAAEIGEIATAISPDLIGSEPHAFGALLQVPREDFDRGATATEEDRLVVLAADD